MTHGMTRKTSTKQRQKITKTEHNHILPIRIRNGRVSAYRDELPLLVTRKVKPLLELAGGLVILALQLLVPVLAAVQLRLFARQLHLQQLAPVSKSTRKWVNRW